MEDIAIKLLDYGVLGILVYMLINKIVNKLDEIEKCLRELKGYLKHG
jgi:hypothetical protein